MVFKNRALHLRSPPMGQYPNIAYSGISMNSLASICVYTLQFLTDSVPKLLRSFLSQNWGFPSQSRTAVGYQHKKTDRVKDTVLLLLTSIRVKSLTYLSFFRIPLSHLLHKILYYHFIRCLCPHGNRYPQAVYVRKSARVVFDEDKSRVGRVCLSSIYRK